MQKWFIISTSCLGLCLILECASKPCERHNLPHIFSRQLQNEIDNKMKRMMDPKELDKPLLDENSRENEFAKRTIVFLDGKKIKPTNMNTKLNKMMEFVNYENLLPKTDNKPEKTETCVVSSAPALTAWWNKWTDNGHKLCTFFSIIALCVTASV
ncbi:uncharacterized protein [Magallana gigas]|uniref:uncharacterized protein n=1 Tax=Magallana gigas TaxID=29159 RepID=UPI00334266F1